MEVNGQVTTPERGTPFNQIILPILAGVSEIQVRFIRRADRLLGCVLSAASILAVAAILLLAWLGEEKTAWNLGQAVEEPVHNPGDSAAA